MGALVLARGRDTIVAVLLGICPGLPRQLRSDFWNHRRHTGAHQRGRTGLPNLRSGRGEQHRKTGEPRKGRHPQRDRHLRHDHPGRGHRGHRGGRPDHPHRHHQARGIDGPEEPGAAGNPPERQPAALSFRRSPGTGGSGVVDRGHANNLLRRRLANQPERCQVRRAVRVETTEVFDLGHFLKKCKETCKNNTAPNINLEENLLLRAMWLSRCVQGPRDIISCSSELILHGERERERCVSNL
mmetsp:Transcript_471/g.987  ORF Transcript_471/g.987 Transcript_471/m.987 type:complete len:242 (+) Transcript_471:497-1222(+)